MKNLKTLLIPVGLIVLVVGIFSFTNYEDGDDEKCKIKIVKVVNGVETVIDSTFDCDKSMTWMSELHGMGDSIHKMIKVMMIDGDSSEMDFKFNIEFDENEENGMKVMKFKGDDGEEIEMSFDFKMLDGEDGVMKMMINGEEMEIRINDLHQHLEKMHKNMDFIHDESGNVEILIKTDEDGEAHTVKIIKTIDDEGNVTVKKIVDGEEMEIDDDEMYKMHRRNQMIFIGDDGSVTKMKGNHEMVIDVKIDSKDGEKTKHIVIITKITSDDESAKKIPTVAGLDKKELSINKLKFSPNPNDGKFDLSFKLNKKEPVLIKIFDVQGKEVYSEIISDFEGKYSNNIDISNNGEGIYILQIVQGEKVSTSKIVIK
ncbi:MAG: T9SS type A sorting domain-containing protein [Flavobacteriales bacterium]|nr:T9SS type A sorting domain-containing protein [Flavobacteriales bacterium]